MFIFSMENPFFRFIGKVVDLVWINVLTVICSVPVFTAGAAFTAMYKALLRIAMREESTITLVFFRDFKESLKPSIKVWIPSLIIFTVLCYNVSLLYSGGFEVYGNIMYAAGISIGLLLIILVLFWHYYFCLLARYDNDNRQTVKNAFLLMIAFFPSSVCILIVSIFPFALMLLSNYFFWLYFLYGFTLPGFFIAMIMGRNFLKTEERSNK